MKTPSIFSLGDKVMVDYPILFGKEQGGSTDRPVLCTIQRILEGDGSLQMFRDDVKTKQLLPSLEKAATEGGLSAPEVKLHWPLFFHRVWPRVWARM